MRATGKMVMLAWAAMTAGLVGCAAGPPVFVNPQADLSFYKKVVVVPFANLSQEGFAGDRVTRAFTTELIMADHYQLVDPWEFRAVLEKIGGEPGVSGNFDPDKIKEALSKVGATGMIRGAVTEFGTRRIGQDDVPVVSFDVEMVDAATNTVVWRTSVSKSGKSRVPLVGGTGTRTFGKLVQDACAIVVEKLEGEAF